MRVVVQQFNSSSTGLVQDGFGHTQNLNFDLCGQQTNNHNFWEWSASPSDDLHCGWISNLGTGGYSGTGNTQRYTVQRSGAGSGGTYPWTTYIDGDPVMSMSTNFATGAEGAASAEYNNCFSCNPLAVAGTVSGHVLGCAAGTTHPCGGGVVTWDVTDQICCNSGWVDVQHPDAVFDSTDGNWNNGSFPQPFTITHP